MSPNGLTRITLAEKFFNPHTDYIEYDENGKVVGMWADYWSNGEIIPEPPSPIQKNIYSKITYSGTKPEIKINGSYKKFTVTFYQDNEPIELQHGDWKFTIDDEDVSNLIEVDFSNLETNQVKIKIDADDIYIGKVLDVAYESYTGVKSNVQINIVGT